VVWVRLFLALLVFLVVLLMGPSQAHAVPGGGTLERIDVNLVIPKTPAQDQRLTTQFELILQYANTPTSLFWQRLEISPTTMRATNLDTREPLRTRAVYVDEDRVIEVNVPQGNSRIGLTWSGPLFADVFPRFWWDQVDAVLAFPFTKNLKPVTQGANVTLTTPTSFPQPSGFRCESLGQQRRCSRWYAQAAANVFKDDEKGGLRMAMIKLDDSSSMIVGGAELLLWIFLLPLTGIYHWIVWTGDKKRRIWMVVRVLVATGLLAGTLAGWAYLADGESSSPLEANLAWTGVVFGVTALLFAHVNRADRWFRNAVFYLAALASFPIGLAILALAQEPLAGQIAAGVLAGVGFIFLVGDTSS
jgi:hypothetical protein